MRKSKKKKKVMYINLILSVKLLKVRIFKIVKKFNYS